MRAAVRYNIRKEVRPEKAPGGMLVIAVWYIYLLWEISMSEDHSFIDNDIHLFDLQRVLKQPIRNGSDVSNLHAPMDVSELD